MTRIVSRRVAPRTQWQLEQQGLHPLLARIYAARGIQMRSELDYELTSLLPPARLTHAGKAATLLADAIDRRARILIVADYDCDGATACAVGIRALRAFGARVDYLVPNRFTYGYGLSPDIVDLAAKNRPDLIVTVDNGIASVDGVARARQLGIATLITVAMPWVRAAAMPSTLAMPLSTVISTSGSRRAAISTMAGVRP